MNKALETLKERGFFQQCTDTEGLSKAMDSGRVTFYVGCDPTGPSLHIGHMVPFFAYRHLVKAGHRGIALVGGGTARIGDPSGKTELRKMISYDDIDANSAAILSQLDRFLGFDNDLVLNDNNKHWLADLNYIDFLRDIGSHFSVNRMLTFEAYKKRLETGLSFVEFNYQLLQSYDFLKLNERHGVALQIGGDDQWGNIVAGIELIRRINGNQVFGLTFPLVTTSDGKKMGKTEKGALFLDPGITPPYDFFQYWRNVTDADVRKFLLMFTFLPVDTIDELVAGDINRAKERLALEVTTLIHGQEEAEKALAGARAAFGGGGDKSAMPTCRIERQRFEAGIPVCELFHDAGLVSSRSDARRLVEQGGALVADKPVTDVKAVISADCLDADGEVVLRAGKKKFVRIITE